MNLDQRLPYKIPSKRFCAHININETKFFLEIVVFLTLIFVVSCTYSVFAGPQYCGYGVEYPCSLTYNRSSCSYYSSTDESRVTWSIGDGSKCWKETCHYDGDVCGQYETPIWRQIYGKIWTDLDKDGVFDANEEWANESKDIRNYKGEYIYTCGYPNQVNPNFKLKLYSTDSEGVKYWKDITGGWTCNYNRQSAYFYSLKSIGLRSTYIFKLEGLPDGYTCDSWVYFKYSQLPSSIKGNLNSGEGCTATVPTANIDSCSGTDDDCLVHNHLWWKLKRDCSTYNLNVTVNKSADSSCGSLGDTMSDVNVYVTDYTNGVVGDSISEKTNSSGIASFNVPVSYKNIKITAAKPGYQQCFLGYTLDLGDPQGCSTHDVADFSMLPVDTYPWLTSIDGDIFARDIVSTIPSGSGLNDFNLSLINSKSTSGVGGYAFTRDLLTLSDDAIFEGSRGGKAYSLDDLSSSTLGTIYDIALSNLSTKKSFAPPSHSEVVEVSSISSFEAGKVYKISVSDFNNSLSSGSVTYTISSSSDETLSSKGISTAILYIEGSDDVVFKHPLLSSSSNSRLVIVANTNIVFPSDIGYLDISSYTVSSNPLIQAAIISSGDITFESLGTNPGTDSPLMVQGPLITPSDINQYRDMGSLNKYYPPVSVSFYPKYLYDLAVIEKYKENQDIKSYTGLSTYDLQFDYQY